MLQEFLKSAERQIARFLMIADSVPGPAMYYREGAIERAHIIARETEAESGRYQLFHEMVYRTGPASITSLPFEGGYPNPLQKEITDSIPLRRGKTFSRSEAIAVMQGMKLSSVSPVIEEMSP